MLTLLVCKILSLHVLQMHDLLCNRGICNHLNCRKSFILLENYRISSKSRHSDKACLMWPGRLDFDGSD